jgi:hypothetical protein
VTTIEVKYSCTACKLVRVVCKVRTRRHDEPISAWMPDLTAALVADHGRRSPGCRPKEFAEVMIPVMEGEPVGSMSS